MPTESLHTYIIAQYIRADSMGRPIHTAPESGNVGTPIHSFIQRLTRNCDKATPDVFQDVTDINAQVEI